MVSKGTLVGLRFIDLFIDKKSPIQVSSFWTCTVLVKVDTKNFVTNGQCKNIHV